MITPEEKEAIKTNIGKGYLKKIQKFLTKQNFLDTQNKQYATGSISHVVNGIRENEHMESLIFKYAYQCLVKKKEEQDERENLVAITKNVA